VHVDPAFLTYTVDSYLREPDRRAAIGTAEELRTLERTAADALRRRPGCGTPQPLSAR
jgi:hypothetical protein